MKKMLTVLLAVALLFGGCAQPADAPPTPQVPPPAESPLPTPTPTSIAPPEKAADLVLINGKIITVDVKDSIAQAVAVEDGKIVKVATDEEVRGLIGSQTDVLDLEGKTVTPGLVDSHVHVIYYGRQFWEGFLNIRYPAVRSKDDLLRLVEEKAKVTPKGQWISGNQGFSLSMADTPDRRELDAVARDNPVYLVQFSGQYAVANSYALRLAGINRFTPNPFGGVIGKDPNGELNGFLFHYPAEDLVRRMVPGWGDRTFEERKEDVLRGAELCLAAGYTSGHDVIVYREDDVEVYKELASEGKLPMRMHLMVYIKSQEHAEKLLRTIEPFKSEMCTFGGWKLALDGSFGAGTALMYDTTLPGAKHSYPYHRQEVLNKMVAELHKSGLQVAFHVMGDRAIDMALDAIEAALKDTPREDHRHRLEHVLLPSQENLERIKELGVVVSTQPQWIFFYGDGIRRMVGEEMAPRFMPLKTMLRMGIPVAFGCDVPATLSHEPEWAFLGSVGRQPYRGNALGPDEGISIQEALRCHTMGSAYANFEEDIKGSIEQGKLADMVVWSEDLYLVATNWDSPLVREDDFLKVEITIVGGNVVHKAQNTTLSLCKGSEFLSSHEKSE